MILDEQKTLEIGNRLRDAVEAGLKARKISARRASIDIVGHDGLIRDIRAGRIPSADRVEALVEYLGLEFYIGPPRDTGPVEQITLNGADYAQVPLFDAMLSAGPGAQNHGSNIASHLAFRRDWLRNIGVTALNACLVRVTGDSMMPTIYPGDMVLIDTTKTEIHVRNTSAKTKRPAPIYAIAEDGHARVKRIERPEMSVLALHSDNPEHGTEILTEAKLANINIIGKVMWWGHTNIE